MKRFITFSLLLSTATITFAQNVDKSITLDEVTVRASKVVNKPDGMVIYPTDSQRQASTNGYSFLEKLTLPNLRVDNISHTISAIDNRGGVQLRINGIIVDKPEMTALDPKDILRIDFIDKPGVRYGESLAYVINIITRRNDSGYSVGTDITSAITTIQGDGMAYGKWNKGKSEWSVSYDINGGKSKGSKILQTANYTLNDGSIYTIERNDVETLRKYISHNAKLTYNWADSTATVFQTSLSGALNKTPDNYSIKEIIDGNHSYKATSRDGSKDISPVLDIYFFRQLTPKQSITANAVGTFISTKTNSFYDEGTPYIYNVDGKSASLLSEMIYENRLKPFTLSTGLNYRYKHTRNDYTGDASAPEAVTAIEALKSKSKIGVLLSNIKAAFKGACLIGHIVNNCVTDNPNLPLSAAQGKALQDALTVLNNELKGTTVKTSEIATNMTDISGKTVVSADIGKNLWWRFSDGRIKFAWDDKLAALTLHLDGNYIGIISLVK